MEIRQIVTFVTAAQHGSFSRAAEELGYTQSAVTIQIKNLEDELNVKLFDRMGKQITITPQGRRFLVHANKILNEVKEAKSNLKGKGQLTGTLTIGTNESLCFTKLPAILTWFRKNHPKVNICIVFESPDRLLDMMEKNKVDIVYFLDEPRYDNNWHKVMEEKERIAFVSSAGHHLAGRKKLRIKDLLDEPFFLTEKNAKYRIALDRYLASEGIAITPFVEISDTEFILKMVESDNGLSFLPEFAVEKSVAEGKLEILDVNKPEIYMYRQIFYHKDKWKTREMDEFIRVANMDL